VEVPAEEVHAWWPWAIAHGAPEQHLRALAVSGRRGHRDAEIEARLMQGAQAEWHVVERRVLWQEWVRITDQLSGAVIWERDQAQLRAAQFAMPRLFQPRLVTKAEERAYYDRVAPSLRVARDLGFLQ
jgi:hypothetical protein